MEETYTGPKLIPMLSPYQIDTARVIVCRRFNNYTVLVGAKHTPDGVIFIRISDSVVLGVAGPAQIIDVSPDSDIYKAANHLLTLQLEKCDAIVADKDKMLSVNSATSEVHEIARGFVAGESFEKFQGLITSSIQPDVFVDEVIKALISENRGPHFEVVAIVGSGDYVDVKLINHPTARTL
uniref:Proteasome subunit alpha n=1 Tax=Panagrellus redivivus TaxID=6233 RepID=A0A7E4VXU5_PANRE